MITKEIITESIKKFYHGSQSDELPIGKTIVWNGRNKKGTFGDYELILEHFRPANKVSRLSSFYLANKKDVAEEYGNVYLVQPVGKFNTQYFGWMSMLLSYINATSYKRNYGYKIASFKNKIDQNVKFICDGYWSGKRPTKSTLARFDTAIDAETYMQETLAVKIKILSEIL